MRSICTFFLLLFLGFQFANAQSILKPFIGVDYLPGDNTPICPIPLYLGSFDNSGLFEGDTIPDFQLFSPDGAPFRISEKLALGKPVLLVNGSYTCPVFRGKVPALNQIVAAYNDQVTICVIYTVEAHPDIDISPYFGTVNTGAPNINAGILYRQPTTYGERLDVVKDMQQAMSINAPIYVDGPCNQWWSVFGPAPNNAYLIDPNGIVVAKHGWFNRSPDDMTCDIMKYFDPNASCGSTGGQTGMFTFSLSNDTIAYGLPGETVYVEAELKNPSTYPVNIEVKRMIENVPAGWMTAMCIDICYAPSVDYTTIQIPANSTQLFIMDFFTDPLLPGKGMAQIGFRNLQALNNKFTSRMYASTEQVSSAPTALGTDLTATVFPQPAKDVAWLKLPDGFTGNGALLQLFDLNGRMLRQLTVNEQVVALERGDLEAGVYGFRIEGLGSGRVVFY